MFRLGNEARERRALRCFAQACCGNAFPQERVPSARRAAGLRQPTAAGFSGGLGQMTSQVCWPAFDCNQSTGGQRNEQKRIQSSGTCRTRNSGRLPRRCRSGAFRLFYEIEADSWRRSGHRGNLFALITSPWRRSFEKRQADCDSGAGHLLATIKPKIARHTIILSTNNLSLLTPPTSLSRRFANPAVINLSIRSSRSLPGTFRVIFLLWRRARSMHSLMILQHDR